MKKYNIFFYKNKKDVSFISTYTREFKKLDDLLEWSNSVLKECNFYTFIYNQI